MLKKMEAVMLSKNKNSGADAAALFDTQAGLIPVIYGA